MPAYVVAEILVTDPGVYEQYKTLNGAIVKAFGGRFLARGSEIESMEGNWLPERLVIIEFPNATAAREWWSSEDYREAKNFRQRSTVTKMLLIEGAPVKL